MPKDTLRYTASVRLGVWDSAPSNNDLLKQLLPVIQRLSNATIETENFEFISTDNPDLASVLAVLDKIVARGNPTFADLNFEKRLLTNPTISMLHAKPYKDLPIVGLEYQSIACQESLTDLTKAVTHLGYLPYKDEMVALQTKQKLSPELQSLCSEEENFFYEQFGKSFSPALQGKLRRQVLIKDLVDFVDDSLIHNRVDFAMQIDDLKWIFEIDGQQHKEPGQREKDFARDTLLNSHKWQVFRIPNKLIHEQLDNWLKDLKSKITDDKKDLINAFESQTVVKLVESSDLHKLAFNTVILPLAVHRCLRGLIQLMQHEVIPLKESVKILVIEEDVAVIAEAFYQLSLLWDNLKILAPRVPHMPLIHLDIIGELPPITVPSHEKLNFKHIFKPSDTYDIILSHSFSLYTGDRGLSEQLHYPLAPLNFVAMRSAIGAREERELQWSEPLSFDLEDIEDALISQTNDIPKSLPKDKLNSLMFFLRLLFRKRDFWDGQLRVITRLLQGKPAIALLPTGGGKSLTYQFCGLLLPGVTIVIDPLISLMNDQVENLQMLGVDLVNCVSSQHGPAEKDAILKKMEEGKLVYCP